MNKMTKITSVLLIFNLTFSNVSFGNDTKTKSSIPLPFSAENPEAIQSSSTKPIINKASENYIKLIVKSTLGNKKLIRRIAVTGWLLARISGTIYQEKEHNIKIAQTKYYHNDQYIRGGLTQEEIVKRTDQAAWFLIGSTLGEIVTTASLLNLAVLAIIKKFSGRKQGKTHTADLEIRE